MAICIGGYTDHVHLLCHLSKKRALSDVMEVLKSNSSKWIKTKGNQFSKFAWQNGYGAFSVGQNEVERVKAYIQNQHEHHSKKTFKEEFLELLHEYDVQYDERYIWD